MEIDLGGLAKEYAVDSAISLMRHLKVTSAMIELAGDVATIGESNNTPWRVGIQDPEGTGSLCAVQLSNAAIATSGNYARRIDCEYLQPLASTILHFHWKGAGTDRKQNIMWSG